MTESKSVFPLSSHRAEESATQFGLSVHSDPEEGHVVVSQRLTITKATISVIVGLVLQEVLGAIHHVTQDSFRRSGLAQNLETSAFRRKLRLL